MEPTTSKNDEQLIIKDFFKDLDNFQQVNLDDRNTINDIYSNYVGRIKETTPEDRSKSKENTNKLRTEVAYIVPSIFSGQPELEVEGIGEEDADLAKIVEKILNHRLENIPQVYEKIEAWVKQAVVFGTSLIRVCWKFETKNNDDGTETPIKDEPDLDVPNILDCYYNPLIADVDNQSALIFRAQLSLDEVKNNPAYDYQGSLGLNRERVESKGNQSSSKYDSSFQASNDSVNLKNAAVGTVDIYEQISKDKILTIADGKERLVLRDTQNPYGIHTSVKLIHEPNCIPNRFNGFGVGHNTLGLGKLYNKMMNRTIDNVNLTNNPFFVVAQGKVLDKKQLVVKTGGMLEIETDGRPLSESVQTVQFPDIKQGAISVMDKIEDEHKRASGANDLVQGSASNKTLGQDQIASTYSSNRFELINRRFKYALADLANIILKMELQNLQSPDAEILKIFPDQLDTGQVDQKGQPIMQSGIRQQIYKLMINQAKDVKFNIKVKGATNVAKNKDVQIKQMIEAYNLFGAVLPPENQMEWAKKILELRGIDEIDKLIPSAEQLKQMQAMQQPMQPQM